MSSKGQDPQEWANKRKAAMERARQIREARANEGVDENHTFKPTLTKRPSYLDKRPTDALDVLSANAAPHVQVDSIFEQPLPGSKSNFSGGYDLPSPGSDALGKEVKKFGADGFPKESGAPSNRQGGGTNYKSNFMKQYHKHEEAAGARDGRSNWENRVNTPPKAPEPSQLARAQVDKYSNQEYDDIADAAEDFMTTLRGGGGRDVGGGWNSDTATSDIYSQPIKTKQGLKPARKRGEPNPPRRAPPAVPDAGAGIGGGYGEAHLFPDDDLHRPQPTRAERRQSQLDALEENYQRQAGGGRRRAGEGPRTEQPTAPRRRTPPRSRLEESALRGRQWNADTTFPSEEGRNGGYGDHDDDDDEPIEPNFAPQDARPQYRGVVQPPNAGRAEAELRPKPTKSKKPEMTQARSRLALLKSKIRSSDDKGEKSLMRSSSSKLMDSEFARSEMDDYNTSDGGRRTAPGQARSPFASDETQSALHHTPDAPHERSGHYHEPWNTPGAYPPGEGPPSEADMSHGAAAAPRAARASRPQPRAKPAAKPRAAPKQQQQQQQRGGTDPFADLSYEREPTGYGSHYGDDERDRDPYADDHMGRGGGGGMSSGARGGMGGGGNGHGRNVDDLPAMAGASTAGLPAGLSETAPVGEQRQCTNCGRSFNPKPYEKHITICHKVNKKRDVFDMKAKRLVDPEQEKLARQAARDERRGGGASRNPRSATERAVGGGGGSSKAKWKKESESFRQAMRANRQVAQAIATGAPLPPPTPSENPDYIACPTCGRRFNQKAGERHIPLCKNIRAKPTSLKRGQGIRIKGGSTTAQGTGGMFR